MTNPPLERAARALFATEAQDDWDGSQLTWDEAPKEYRQHARRQVRAVLMAVREPDEAMLTAIQSRPLSEKAKDATNSFDRMNASTEALWQAGIDAILNDGEANG